MLTDERIAEITARVEATPPGAWKVLTEYGAHLYVRAVDVGGIVAKTIGSPNAEFIAHAREDIPALLAEVARLRAELAALKPLAEAAQWVPVTEALPGERNPDEGIVALLENGVRVDAMHGKEGWFQWDYELSDWLPLVGVTHWYRVPPPPTK